MAGKNVLIVNDLNFDAEILQSDKPVLVDFTATWCGPCRQLAPIIDQLADETVGTYKIAKIDIDEAPATANKYGVKSVPMVVAIKGGKEIARQLGVSNKAKLKAMLEG
jgi:thioredoxin 1